MSASLDTYLAVAVPLALIVGVALLIVGSAHAATWLWDQRPL